MVDTGAAVVDEARTGTVDGCREFTTLAIASVAVCLHRAVRRLAGRVGVEMDRGGGRNDDRIVRA